MPGPEITLACQDYDQTRALRDGPVTAAGFELKLVSISPPSQMFLRMLHDEEFDASEMSLSNYMIACGRGDRRFNRKSTRLNSSHRTISYAVFCLKKKK